MEAFLVVNGIEYWARCDRRSEGENHEGVREGINLWDGYRPHLLILSTWRTRRLDLPLSMFVTAATNKEGEGGVRSTMRHVATLPSVVPLLSLNSWSDRQPLATEQRQDLRWHI